MADSEAVAPEPTRAQVDYKRAKALIEPLLAQGKTEDAIGIVLVNNGFTFAKAKLYRKKVLEDLGVVLSNRNRNEQTADILVAGKFAPKTWEHVLNAVAHITKNIAATNDKQAMKAVKYFAKQQKIDLPVKPKGTRGRSPNSFRALTLTWIQENPSEEEAAFETWLQGQGSESDRRYFARIFAMAKVVYASGVEAGQAA
jgi:hypothetical protein